MIADPFDQYLEAAIDQAGGVDLRNQVPARPLPRQEKTVASALDVARQRGLRVPTGLRIRYRVKSIEHADRALQYGQFNAHPDGTLELTVRADLPPQELFRVILHEAQHISDYVTGVRYATALASEQAANAFSNGAMAEFARRRETPWW
jgi:hypothetical protein